MSSEIVSLFRKRSGKDITHELLNLGLDTDVFARQLVCLRNLFFIGKVDNRHSPQCLFAEWLLIAIAIMCAFLFQCVVVLKRADVVHPSRSIVAIIGFKFLSALQFGRTRKPEECALPSAQLYYRSLT